MKYVVEEFADFIWQQDTGKLLIRKKNHAYPGRLNDTYIKPDVVKPGEEPVKYLDAAKAAFGLEYALVDATATGNVAEYNEAQHRIDILSDLLTRAPPYRAGTHATFAFQSIVNDIFTHEAVHQSGEQEEAPAIAASINRFRNNRAELLAFHNWLGVFGIELDSEYAPELNKLEAEVFGPVSFKGAIYDVDGVICDSAHDIHFVCWKAMFEEAIKPKVPEFEFTLQMYIDEVDGIPGLDGATRILSKFGFTAEEIKTVWYPKKDTKVKEALTQAEAGLRRITEYPTTRTLIRELKQHGIKVSTASSSGNAFRLIRLSNINIFNPNRNPEELKEADRKYLRAADSDTVAIDSEGDGHQLKNKGKPYPEIFLFAAYRLGLRVEECVVFEDAKDGVAAGKDGGFKTIGIDRENAGLLGRADWVVKDLGEVNYERMAQLMASSHPVMILPVLLEQWDDDHHTGSFLATVYAYRLAVNLAREKYNVDLEQLWKESRVRICVMHDAGSASRCSPMSICNNSRGNLELVGRVQVPAGEVPLTLMLAVAMQNSKYAGSNDGATIDMHYVSQLYFNRDAEGNLTDDYKDVADATKPYTGYDVIILSSSYADHLKIQEEAFEKVFGYRKVTWERVTAPAIPTRLTKFTTVAKLEDITEKNLADLGMYIADGTTALKNMPKGSLKKEQALEHFNAGLSLAFSCGSHRAKPGVPVCVRGVLWGYY